MNKAQLEQSTVRTFLAGTAVVVILAIAACDKKPAIYLECGGGAQFRCPPGLYCELGPNCGGIDHLGECRPQPTDCSIEDTPVCGCDNADYPSPCFANANGVTVAYEGNCIKKEKSSPE